ncbi:MAG: hypothetical protein ACOYI8_08310 [Christensenellales bacterium]
MKRRLRQILSFALLALLLASAVAPSLSPAAAEDIFEIDENGVLTAYNGPGGNVKIPKGGQGNRYRGLPESLRHHRYHHPEHGRGDRGSGF